MERSFGKVNAAISKVQSGAAQAGRAVAGGALIAGAALAEVVSTGAEFEQTLVGAGAKFAEPIDRGTEAFEGLSAAALAVSEDTEFSATAAAGALKFMATAGESAAVSMGSIKTFADLATVAETDLASAADLASDSIGPLGLATDDLSKKSAAYARTADLMAKTTNIANVGFEDLFEAIKAGAKPFIDTGQEVEQFLASIALIGGAGIKGSKAGKDVARAMARITDKSTKAQKALRRLDVDFQKNGNVRDFLDIMEDLEVKLKGVSEVKRAQAVSDIFGANSKAAGLAILAGLEKAREFEDKLASVSGFTAEVAAKTRDTALGKIKTFWSTVESIVVGVFFVIQDDVEKITTAMTEWAKANKATFSSAVTKGLAFMRDNFEQIADKGPKILALVVALSAMAKTLTLLQGIMSIVAATTAVTAGSIGLISLSVLALIALGAAVFIFWDDMVAGVERGDAAWTAAAVAVGLIAAPFALVGAAGVGLVVAVEAIIDAFDAMVTDVGEGMSFLADDIVKKWEPIGKFFTDLWAEIEDSFFRIMLRISARIESFIQDLTGIDLFGVNSKGAFFEKIEPPPAEPPPAANDAPRRRENVFLKPPPAANTLPPAADNSDFGLTSFDPFEPTGQTSTQPAVVDTTGSAIATAVTESISSLKLDINLNDPGGAVESIEQPSNDDAVRVTSSGDL
jgi:TP901 family phage tail tape measure protein